jgi:hypothetical protein
VRTRFVAGIVVLVVTVACSGDDDGTTSSTRPDAVKIGPGASTPPTEVIADEATSAPPEWVTQVPSPTRSAAADPTYVKARRLAASGRLVGSSAGATLSDTTTSGAPASLPPGDYVGTMSLEIAYYNYCVTGDGNLRYAGSAEYELDAEVFVNEPAEHEGTRERSPFNLIIASETGVEGSLMIVSGQVATDTRDGESFVIDYWDIEEDDGEVEGTLTDRWPGLAYNLITTSQPIVPCQPGLTMALPDTIAEGAQLSGTIDEDEAELELRGQSYDQEVRFRAVIDVTRSE